MKEEKSFSPLYFSSQMKFHKWLLKNHDKMDVIWLVIKKKNAEIPCITYKEAVEESLCFGWIDGQIKSLNDECFMQRFTPRKERSLWSKINKDKATKLIKEGRMTEAGLKKIEDAKRNGRWQKAYTTPKQLSMTKEMKKSLAAVPDALYAFKSFAPSHQNMYIHWINDAKKEETKKRRIEKVILWALQKKKPGLL